MSRSESTRHAVERLTVELHERLRVEGLESDAAEAVREKILDVWESLEPLDKELLNDISGDLYALSDEEEREDDAGDGLAPMKDAWARQSWRQVLALARRRIPGLAEASRAYARGHAYASLGLPVAAEAFFSDASTREPRLAHVIAAQNLWGSTNEFVRLIGGWHVPWPEFGEGTPPFRAQSTSLHRSLCVEHDSSGRLTSRRVRSELDELVITCTITDESRDRLRALVADWLTDGEIVTGAGSHGRGPLDVDHDEAHDIERAA